MCLANYATLTAQGLSNNRRRRGKIRMKLSALALDYDGTIAVHGVFDPAVQQAIGEARNPASRSFSSPVAGYPISVRSLVT